MVEPRSPIKTVKFVDEYCLWYKNLFSDVRNFEAFKYLHIGCISDLKRKSLPEIAKIVGLDNYQGLHPALNYIIMVSRTVTSFAITTNFRGTKRKTNHFNY